MRQRVMVNTPYSTGFRQYHKLKPASKSMQDFATEESEFAGQLFVLQVQSLQGGKWRDVVKAYA